MIRPSYLTDLEQISVAKILLQSFPHLTKTALIVGVSRQCVSSALNKWGPMWAAYGSHLSILPMPHDYYDKELPQEHIDRN